VTSNETASMATDRRTTMRAVVQDVYGEAGDVLRVEEIDRPPIGPDEVLVHVEAAGVDKGVWHVMAGLPYPIRLAGFGVRAPKDRVRGMALAGRVEAIGAAVTGFRVGDDVYGVGEGSFAEYARASEKKLALRPGNLSARQAAAVPVSAPTALQAVRDHGKVQPGQKVLVIGASGGVGTYAVQLAKAYGAEVTGVSSTAKTDVVQAAGADHVLDYTRDDVTSGEQRYDVVLDIGGNRPIRRLRRALTDRGTLVVVGGETGGRWLGGTERLLGLLLLKPFVRQALRNFVASDKAADLQALTALIESGQVTPVVDRTFPLDEAATAVQYMHEGRARGKVVLDV
jgi:NADPH:quinone reductase-like Zn-dependent oxidoreductase